MKKQKFISFISIIIFVAFQSPKINDDQRSQQWLALLEEDYDQYWDVYMGAPHTTVKDLDGIDPKSDGKNSKAHGLNNDPKNVFAFENNGGEVVVHISGEIYGALSSKNECENYRLQLQYKWGDKKWAPRLERERDSGILYHYVGDHGAFWNVWMQSREFQVQERDCGDYYALAKTQIDIPAVKGKDGKEFDYQKGAERQPFSSVTKLHPGLCNKGNENPHGEWNTLDLLFLADSSIHFVNGQVVMALYNSKYQNADKQILSLKRGKIQIQPEGAEIFYKNIKIKSIDAIPEKYKNQL